VRLRYPTVRSALEALARERSDGSR
jgi:hypothetical protein